MKKTGFTIVELLAIIVIIAVIALIAIPIIGNVIETSQKNSFLATTNGLLDSAKLYLAESHDIGEHQDELYINVSNVDLLEYNGTLPDDLYIDLVDGKTSIYASKDKWCAIKNLNEKSTTVYEADSEECLRGLDINMRFVINNPTGKDNWYITNPEVKVTISNTDSMGIDMVGYEYAISTDRGQTFGEYSATLTTDTFNINVEGKTVIVKMRAKNADNKYSRELRTKTLKIDKTPPTSFTVNNPTGGNGTNVPYALTISAVDDLSGLASFQYSTDNSNFKTYSNSSVSPYTTSVYSDLQDTTLYIRATDHAGNISASSQTRIYIANVITKYRYQTYVTQTCRNAQTCWREVCSEPWECCGTASNWACGCCSGKNSANCGPQGSATGACCGNIKYCSSQSYDCSTYYACNYWSAWSDWSTTACVASGTVNCESAECLASSAVNACDR